MNNGYKEQENKVNVITYILSLTESAHRFSRGLPPFDLTNVTTAEFMVNKNLAFIEDGEIPYRKAHEIFLEKMLQDGWRPGPEDFNARTHPDMIPYDQLPKETKERYAFSAAIVCSAKEFYDSIRAEMEETILDDCPAHLWDRNIRNATH